MATTAESEARRIIALAEAQAQANRLLKASLTPEVVRLREIEVQEMAVEKWDGKMPQVAGGSLPLVNLP